MAHLRSPAFLIGRNKRGRWVVRDPFGMRGGIFTSRAEASRFAMLDHGRPRVAVLVPYTIEFDAVHNHG